MGHENMTEQNGGAQGKATLLYTRYKNLIAHYARALVNDPAWIDDAIQDTVCRMLRDIDKFGDVDSAASINLLITMTRCSAATVNHKNRRHGMLLESEDTLYEVADDNLPDIQFEVERSELIEIIHEEIEKLPETYRLPMLLRYAHDIEDNHTIARILGITANNVAVRLVRGREKLVLEFKRRGDLPWTQAK